MVPLRLLRRRRIALSAPSHRIALQSTARCISTSKLCSQHETRSASTPSASVDTSAEVKPVSAQETTPLQQASEPKEGETRPVDSAQPQSSELSEGEGVKKPKHSDWFYMAMGTLAATIIGVPMLVIAHMQDNGDFRDWVEERVPPSVVALAREYYTIPFTAPRGWRESEQPKGCDAVQIAIALPDGSISVASGAAETHVSSVIGASADQSSVIAAGTLWDADTYPPIAPPVRHSSFAVDGLLHRQGIWSVESKESLDSTIADVDRDLERTQLEIGVLAAQEPDRPLLVEAAREWLQQLERIRLQLLQRRASFSTAPLLHIVPPAAKAQSSFNSSGGWFSWLWRSRGNSGSTAVDDDGSVLDPHDPFDIEPGSQAVFVTPLASPSPAGHSSSAGRDRTVPGPRYRFYFDAGEDVRATERLKRIALRLYVNGPGETALSKAYADAGVERNAKQVVTLETLFGSGGDKEQGKADKDATGGK